MAQSISWFILWMAKNNVPRLDVKVVGCIYNFKVSRFEILLIILKSTDSLIVPKTINLIAYKTWTISRLNQLKTNLLHNVQILYLDNWFVPTIVNSLEMKNFSWAICFEYDTISNSEQRVPVKLQRCWIVD